VAPKQGERERAHERSEPRSPNQLLPFAPEWGMFYAGFGPFRRRGRVGRGMLPTLCGSR
jgi:hypothetical protein